ncbi:hypothetical protein LMG7053_05604 [Achromobacter ruhlandii]|uniref:Uncharacterized protein n=1 Tax=Achromobacter ruhlandii TaxID=72557 RepID=A0ABM8M2Y8_9BURK|nr:hypothetical protein LMG7053_05604 [Achromobacter ruhlandii]
MWAAGGMALGQAAGQHRQFHPRLPRRHDRRPSRLQPQPVAQRRQAGRRQQVGLVQHQQVGRAQLALRGIGQQGIGQRVADAAGIHQHHHRLQLQKRIRQAHLRDAPGVGHAAGLDHDPFGRGIQCQHPRQRVVQAAGHRAADAAIGQPDHLVRALRQQAGVDIHRPEIVDQHRGAAAAGRQHVVQQGGLAGAQETAHHRQRDARHVRLPGAPAAGRR